MKLSCARGESEGLSDAPLPWLCSLAKSLSSLDRISLLMTCKALRDVVLYVSVAKLAVDLPTELPTRTALGLKRAQAVLKRARDVTCQIQFSPGDLPFIDVPAVQMAAGEAHTGYLSSFLQHHSALLGHPLNNITHMTIKGMYLTELVPWSVVACCPSLMHLVLDECTITRLPVAESLLPCTSLRHLTVSKAIWELYDQQPALNMGHLQGLSELHIKGWAMGSRDWQSVVSLGGQLTYLHLDMQDSHTPICLPAFTTLTRLALPDTFVWEETFSVLLGMEQLRRVQVGYISNIKSDFTEAECRWEILGVGTISMGALARLPCKSIGRIVNSEDRFDVILMDDIAGGAETAQAAVANLTRCPDVRLGGAYTVVDCCNDKPAALVAALPLLRFASEGDATPAGHVELDIMSLDPVTIELLQALPIHVPARFNNISFLGCHWQDSHVSTVFLTSLPATTQRCGLLNITDMDELTTAVDQIKKVAPYATRPITLLMDASTSDEDMQSLLLELHGFYPAAQLITLDKDIVGEPNCHVVV